MKIVAVQTGFVIISLAFSSLTYARAQEAVQTTTSLTPVPSGLYSIPGLPPADSIVVNKNNGCNSPASGNGTVVRAPYRTGILCLSNEGYAYINGEKKFSQSSKAQQIQSGVYGPAATFDDGRREEIVVLADTRHCVFNPTFDKSGAWTSEEDDGRANRRGITILNTKHQIICLSPSNGDLAVYIPSKNITFLVTTPPGVDNHQNDPNGLMMELAKTIIDAVYPEDEWIPASRSPAKKQGYYIGPSLQPKRSYVDISGRLLLPFREEGIHSQRLNETKIPIGVLTSGATDSNPVWSGAIAYGTYQSVCDPTICSGIPNCTVGDGQGQCSVPDTIYTDIDETDYSIDVSKVVLPGKAVCEATATGPTYQLFSYFWGGIGGYEDDSTLVQSGVGIYYNCANGVFSGKGTLTFVEFIEMAANYNMQFTTTCPGSGTAFTGTSSDVAPNYTMGTATITDPAESSCNIQKTIAAAPGYPFGNYAEGVYERTQAKSKKPQAYAPDVRNNIGPFINITYSGQGTAYVPAGEQTFNIPSQPMGSDYNWTYMGNTYDVSQYDYLETTKNSCDWMEGSASQAVVSGTYTFMGNPDSLGECF